VGIVGNSPANAFTVTANSAINTIGSIVTPTSIALISNAPSGGNITIGGLLGGSKTNTVTLTTFADGGIFQNAHTIQANNVNLNTGTAGIGSALAPFQINAATSLSFSSLDLININNNATTPLLTINVSSCGANKPTTIVSANNITTSGNINGTGNSPINLTSNNGNITINSTVGGAFAGDVTLSAKGNITKGASASALVQSPVEVTLIASSGTGNIGASSAALKVNTALLSATAGATSGLVNVQNTSTTASTIDSSSSGGNFTALTAGDTTLGNISTVKGSIKITESAGVLSTAGGSNLTANGGTLTLTNSNVTSGKIVIGAGSTIQTHGTGGGNVSILIGATTTVPGTQNTSVTYSPPYSNKLYIFGPNGINVVTPAATQVNLSAIGAKVIFNAGSNKNNITVNGTNGIVTQITADPPASLSDALANISTPVILSKPTMVSSTQLSNRIVSPSLVADHSGPAGQLQVKSINVAAPSSNLVEIQSLPSTDFKPAMQMADGSSDLATGIEGCNARIHKDAQRLGLVQINRISYFKLGEWLASAGTNS
jgi:hypothetical protein